ncbi:hypothetical protein HAX54_040830 [Datura stramonium]|uniref:Uncharacterized protein n=1 Tax=Datura stramonium TaxID=4076 RepID=A0ABS8VT35_DATST|nr:hypothetical protein [Datura stramonium]
MRRASMLVERQIPRQSTRGNMASQSHGIIQASTIEKLGRLVLIPGMKNKSFRSGAGMTERVTARHFPNDGPNIPYASDGGVDGRQFDDGSSLVPLRIGPFSSWAAEAPMDHQVIEGPCKPRSLAPLFKADGVDDSPSRK